MDENTLQQLKRDVEELKQLRQKLDIYATNLEKINPKLASALISEGAPNQFLGDMSTDNMIDMVKNYYRNYDKQIIANIYQERDRDPLKRTTQKITEYEKSKAQVKEIIQIFKENGTPLDIEAIKREVGNHD